MLKNFKFSAILPVYKKVTLKVFINSFESILNQKLLPNELIIIYDGPVLGSIKNYINFKKKKFSFIKIYSFPSNKGLGKILNYAVKKAKYSYIARCDADDISLSNRFKEQINFLKKNKTVDVLSSNILELDGLNSTLKKVPENNIDIMKSSNFRNPINHNSVIFKKKTIINSGNYKDINYYEDYFLWLRVIKNGGKFYNLQKVYVNMIIDNNYYLRRSGLSYFLSFIKFQKKAKKMKLISKHMFYFNIFLRFHIAYLPIKIIKKLYNFFLRIPI